MSSLGRGRRKKAAARKKSSEKRQTGKNHLFIVCVNQARRAKQGHGSMAAAARGV